MSIIDFAITEEGKRISILSDKINRHGFIAGATGTGKTVSLKVLAEKFSSLGIPKGLKREEKNAGLQKRNSVIRASLWSFLLFRRRKGFPCVARFRRWDHCS